MTNPTTTDVIARAKLTCNHVIDVEDPTVGLGDKAECRNPRCAGRTRRIKLLTPTGPTPADEVQAAEARIDQAMADAIATPPSVVIEATPEPTPAPEAPQAYDVMAARDEHRAMKAWVDGGSQGDRPDTANLDAMNAAHAGGNRGLRVRPGQREAKAPRTSARRAEANARQREVGFEGRKAYAKAVTEAELAEWIATVRAAHPDTRKEDELEQAYWMEGFKVSRKRFYAAWQAVADPTA